MFNESSAKHSPAKTAETAKPLWPGRLQAALHARHGGYRVLCSGDTEWDAVEGARTLTTNAALAAEVVDANVLLNKQREHDEKLRDAAAVSSSP